MRNLVLALILANLAFAAWNRWYAAEAPAPPAAEREFGEILLASEFARSSPPIEIAAVRVLETETGPGGATATAPDAPGAPVGVGPLPPPGADGAAGAVVASSDPAVAESAPDTSTSPAGAALASAEAGPQPAESGLQPAVARPPPAGPAQAPTDSGPQSPANTGSPAEAAPSRAEADARRADARTGGAVCTSVGPFRELSQVTAAAANLRADGYEPRQRAGEGEIWSGYWVYLEGIESAPEAQTMIEGLHAGGLTDAYVIPNSDSGRLISLGVFSEIIRASRLRERVGELGYDATIADRVRRATVYWIDVDLAPGTDLDLEELQPPGRIIRLEQRPCAAVEL